MSTVVQAPWPFQARRAGRPAQSARRPARRLGHRPVLDGIRGLAVLLVILMHTGVLHNGFMGVDIFFVLSGFLITSLLLEGWDREATIDLRRFYARRARRLLPALFWVVAAVVVVDVAVLPLGGWPIGTQAAVALLFVNNWVAGLGHSAQMAVLNPTWSLGQEEQFYLLWPLTLWLLLRRRTPPWVILGLLGVLIVALLIIEPYVFGAVANYSHYYSPLDRATELLFGCAGALVWRHRLIRLPSGRVAGAAATVCVGALVAWVLFSTPTNERLSYLVAAGLALPAMILLMESPRSPLTRLLSTAPLRHLGRVSYCVYLCHILVRDLVQHYVPGQSIYFNCLATLTVSVGVGTISWRLLESKVLLA